MAIYSHDTRIRYNEIDSEGKLTVAALIDLFQNNSVLQSEDLGVGIQYLKDRHRAWFLSAWQVVITRMPGFSEKVQVQTWSYGINRMLGLRNFRLLDETGAELAVANSTWAYVDTETGIPVSCPNEEAELYGVSPKAEMNYAPRKIKLPENMEKREPFEVKYYFIDTNKHMNNGKYVMAAQEYLPENFKIDEVRTEYKKSAKLGDVIIPKVKTEEKCVTVTMDDENGETYAVVQFLEH